MKEIIQSLAGVVLLIHQCVYAQMCKVDDLRVGDLVFVTARDKGWSGAINDVTAQNKYADYSHVGMVYMRNDRQLQIVHAGPERGVEILDITEFLNDTTRAFDAFRLKNYQTIDWDLVMQRAESMLGAPYNFSYVLNDTSFYCSDFIYRILLPYEVFALEPMTFMKDGVLHPFWVEYYSKLNLDVPEGKPGCNPNGLASDEDVYYLGRIKLD